MTDYNKIKENEEIMAKLTKEYLKKNKVNSFISPMKNEAPEPFKGEVMTTRTYVGVSHRSLINFD